MSHEALKDKETARIEAFSDGVFAVAITLLVVGLVVPEAKAGEAVNSPGLLRALAAVWPQFVAFVTSFAAILLLWISHHQTFLLIRKTNRRLMVANGLLLLFVTLIPFPTALLARYINTPAAPVAAALYAANYLAITAIFIVFWKFAMDVPGLIDPTVSLKSQKAIQQNNMIGLIPYVVAFGVAFFFPYLTVFICMALSVRWVITGNRADS
jgi:uncharacterized membrane protein